MAGADEICVIGGGEIYRQALPIWPTGCYVTHVLAGGRRRRAFSEDRSAIWRLVRSEDIPAGEKDTHATRYAVYERRPAPNSCIERRSKGGDRLIDAPSGSR